jgi:outer membrane protein TolC
MYRAGNQSITDVLRQKADIAQAELDLLIAEQNYQTSIIQLSEALGEDSC